MSENMIHMPRARAAIDFTRLEQDLSETAKQQPKPKPQPKVTADSVLQQYDATAKAVVSMGDEIRERIRKLEAGLSDCHDVLKLIEDASNKIREQGNHVQLLIEEAAATSMEVRAGVDEVLKRILSK